MPVLARLLTCNGKYLLSQCEFSPRWEMKGGKTAMARCHTFETVEQLVEYCQEKVPDTLQFGGIVPTFALVDNDKEAGMSKMKRNRDMCTDVATGYGPIVLDFDMNDYDREGICGCLKQKKVCNKCFRILGQSTLDIVHFLLEQVFGFTDIFDVFSGKRGIHIWICCDRAVEMTKDERQTFIDRLCSPLLNEGIMEDIYQHFLKPMAEEYPTIFTQQDKQTLVKRLYPKFDAGVTSDPCHLKKLPLLPHQDTRIVASIMDRKHTFIPSQHTRHIAQLSPEDYNFLINPVKRLVEKQEKKRRKLDEWVFKMI